MSVTVPHRNLDPGDPLTRHRRSTLIAALATAGLVLALAGCAAEPAPAPASAPASAPTTPASEPVPANGDLASVLVRPDALEYLDGDGVAVEDARDAFSEPIDTALARLTELLGDPADETYESPYTSGSGTLYRWNGLALDEFPAEMVAEGPDAPVWGVRLESESVDGIDLVTVDGLGVGDAVPADLETSVCGALLAEVIGTLGVEVDLDGTESAVSGIRSPVYTDVCE